MKTTRVWGYTCNLHDVNSASDMHEYGIFSGNVGPKNVGSENKGSENVGPENMGPENVGLENVGPENKVKVVGRWKWWKMWLPDVTNWVGESQCVAYDISNYVVTKRNNKIS